MQKIKSVAALGEELGGKEVKWKTTIFRKSAFLQEKLALRGSLAVTWLTVYRQLQVMRAGEDGPGWGPYGYMAGPVFKHEMLRIVLSDFDEGQE